MNSKSVLKRIMTLLSSEEVTLTYAKLADGTIVESATFDVGEDLFVVSEDGTKSPAPNGFHDLMLKDEEGNETLLKVKSEDGKIVERENVEMADVKTEPIPQGTGEELPENERPEQPNSVKSGTIKMAEEDAARSIAYSKVLGIDQLGLPKFQSNGTDNDVDKIRYTNGTATGY